MEVPTRILTLAYQTGMIMLGLPNFGHRQSRGPREKLYQIPVETGKKGLSQSRG
jgi:hypothetical protein